MTYAQARADHEYLWQTYGPAYDMTGGYVESDDLYRLLINPTKTTARKCYVDQICYWLTTGPDPSSVGRQDLSWQTDPKVRRISRRHGYEYEFDFLVEAFEPHRI